MKIRTDFVTNSSSSSFILEIKFKLVDGGIIKFRGEGGTGETGRIDYFDSDAVVTVSPRQLGTAKNVEEMIRLLTDGVIDDCWTMDSQIKIFEKPNETEEEHGAPDGEQAYDFIKTIRHFVKSMDDIESVTISGDEYNYCTYKRTYTYNRKSGQYYGKIAGSEFEKNGSSGGDLRFDTSGCAIGDDEENYDDGPEGYEVAFYEDPGDDRIAAYYNPKEGNQYKLFEAKFENAILDEIMNKYHYSQDEFADNFYLFMEDKIPGYAGVRNIQELTATLFSAFLFIGKADEGFAEELQRRKVEIENAFTSIEGTSMERSDDDIEEDFTDGYDFEMKDGKYEAHYRIGSGGW